MNIEYNTTWFRAVVEPQLQGFQVTYRFYPEGDFGALDQVAFDSDDYSGEIDYWSSGWLSVGLWDHRKNEQMLNVFLEPDQATEKIEAIRDLGRLLGASF